jgi:hypothetical protein
MNEWQTVRQIQYLLENRKWGGASGADLVFARKAVYITQAPEVQVIKDSSMPMATIMVGNATTDAEHSELDSVVRGSVDVAIFQTQLGDNIGEQALVGANRLGGATSSKGRGLLEIQAEVYSAVSDLQTNGGIRVRFNSASKPIPEKTDDDFYTVWRIVRYEATMTEASFYHPVTNFTATDATGGDATLSMKLPPDRYDKLSIIIRRASGSTAPTTVTGGTGVTHSITWDADTSLTTVSTTDDPGAGTWSYSVFATYNESEPASGTDVEASAIATREGVVVT